MARYPNGRIPKSALVHLGGQHWLTPGTKARWDALVADVLENEGVRLRITSGPNAYRDYDAQVEAKKRHGSNAAWPGTSSHGGVFNGRDSMAIDVGNWGEIGKTKFYAYARKHGFEPNYFDWEPWHIIDWSPWTVPSPPAPPKTEPKPKVETEMRIIFNKDDSNDETRRATVGEFTFHVLGPGASARERRLWGKPINVSQAEWDGFLALTNVRRAMVGLAPLKGVRGEF
jgi:hypothetical protein